MAKKQKATQRTSKAKSLKPTGVILTPENREFLYLRKARGEGSLSHQVNRLIDGARAVSGE